LRGSELRRIANAAVTIIRLRCCTAGEHVQDKKCDEDQERDSISHGCILPEELIFLCNCGTKRTGLVLRLGAKAVRDREPAAQDASAALRGRAK
jgi:hypothetical protein